MCRTSGSIGSKKSWKRVVAAQSLVQARKPDDRLVGFRTAAGEEHPIESGRRQLRQLGGEFNRGRRRNIQQPEMEGKRLELVGNGVGDFLVAEAKIDIPDGRAAVEVLFAVRIPHN